MIKTAAPPIAAALCAGLLAACGGGDDAATREADLESYAASHGVDAEVEVDASGEVRTVSVAGPGGSRAGMGLEPPEGMPDDVALYPGLNITGSSPIGGAGLSLQGLASDDIDAVAEFYRERMAADGWEATADDRPAPTMRTLNFAKDGRIAGVNLIDAGAQGTNVQIMMIPGG